MREKQNRKRVEYFLIVVLALISLGIDAVFIAKSTEREIDTIVVAPEGDLSQKTTDVRILLSDYENEALWGAVVRVDDSENEYYMDEQGYVLIENLLYGNHVLHITTSDGRTFDYEFQLTLDFDLETTCRIIMGDKPVIATPVQISEVAFQLYFERESWFLSEDTMIVKENGTHYLSDGTEVTGDGKIILADGSVYENGYFTFPNGKRYRSHEEVIFTGSGTVVFPDGSVLTESRSFYIVNNSVRIIGERPADLHNGYYIDKDRAVITPEGNRIMPDGAVEFANGIRVEPGCETMSQAAEQASLIEESIQAEEEESPVNGYPEAEHSQSEDLETTENNNSEAEDSGTTGNDNSGSGASGTTGNDNSEAEASDTSKPEDSETGNTKPESIPASVEEYSNQTWVQASKLHIFSDSENLSGGAFKDDDGQLVIMPGARGTYYFRIATRNERVSFLFKLYHNGELGIPMKMQLVYPDGQVSDWFSLKDSVSPETALAFRENVVPSNSYSNYEIRWWWDETVDDIVDTQAGVRANKELTEYELYAVLQVTTE